MNRVVIFVGLVLLILGLAVVHFSLANAQPGISPASVHGGSPGEHTPLPPNTPTPNIHGCFKAHKTDEEKQGLIDEFRRMRPPYTCPHGRPIITELTLHQMEKSFRRRQ